MGINLTLKNIPVALVEELRARARRHHRSLQGEVLAILEEALRPRRLSVGELHERVRQMGLTTPEEATAIIRAERDER